jgi:hypothetical protein
MTVGDYDGTLTQVRGAVWEQQAGRPWHGGSAGESKAGDCMSLRRSSSVGMDGIEQQQGSVHEASAVQGSVEGVKQGGASVGKRHCERTWITQVRHFDGEARHSEGEPRVSNNG